MNTSDNEICSFNEEDLYYVVRTENHPFDKIPDTQAVYDSEVDITYVDTRISDNSEKGIIISCTKKGWTVGIDVNMDNSLSYIEILSTRLNSQIVDELHLPKDTIKTKTQFSRTTGRKYQICQYYMNHDNNILLVKLLDDRIDNYCTLTSSLIIGINAEQELCEIWIHGIKSISADI